ncbi:hypothetical protein SFUMM280S_07723 [Streptomyces fumanus]
MLRIERLRMANGEPMAIETTHLSAKRFPGLRRSLVKYTSLYTALAEVYDVHLAEAEETIETSLATPREAGLLGTDVGLPMLMLSRHSGTGTPSRWSGSTCPAARSRFSPASGRPRSGSGTDQLLRTASRGGPGGGRGLRRTRRRGLLGLPDLAVDPPVADDPGHRGEDHHGEEAEGDEHSDEGFCLFSGHAHHCPAGRSLPGAAGLP